MGAVAAVAMDVTSANVDWKAAEDLGYIYGPARCVQVSLDCEELFMRDWTVRQSDPNHPAPMPLDVQKVLGIPPQAPAPAPVQGAKALWVSASSCAASA